MLNRATSSGPATSQLAASIAQPHRGSPCDAFGAAPVVAAGDAVAAEPVVAASVAAVAATADALPPAVGPRRAGTPFAAYHESTASPIAPGSHNHARPRVSNSAARFVPIDTSVPCGTNAPGPP